MLMTKHIFPYCLSVLDIVAALVYLYHKDYNRAIYWLSAASLTFSTTRF